MHELSKEFVFDAAHTLKREVDAAYSKRIHGHSYWALVTLRGTPDPATGMILDLGIFDKYLKEMHEQLDHMFLDEIPDLGPATVENLSMWIWRKLQGKLPGLYSVTVSRKSFGDKCTYFGNGK